MATSQQALIDSISKLTVYKHNVLALPDPFKDPVDNYADLKKALVTAGGKYLRGGYFEFKESAAVIKQRLIGGEVINDVKKYQYFPTPEDVAKRLVKLAKVSPDHKVLEPSAGQGAIAQHILCDKLAIVELMPENQKVLSRKVRDDEFILAESVDILMSDFLDLRPSDSFKFDRIIANPPFTKKQDIKHVMHMFDCLKDGGRLVSVMSNSWRNNSDKLSCAFREFMAENGTMIYELEAGTFKASGTNIATCIVVIDKA